MSISLISSAYAAVSEPAQQAAGSGISTIIMLIGFILIFYFLLWRPQAKRAKEHQTLLSNITKGDEVVTAGGILGKVTKIDDQFVTLEIATGVEIIIQKQSIASTLPKGTMKGS